MVRIVRIPTVQPHWVPSHPTKAQGPFSPELLAKELPVIDTPDDQDDTPPGWTAQSPTPAPVQYRCLQCDAVLLAHELDGHECGA